MYLNINNKKRVCPVCCVNTQVLQIHNHSFAEFEGVSFLKGYNIVCCEICGGVYADNIPAQSDFDLYYKEHNKYEHKTSNMPTHLKGHYERLASIISFALPNKGACILDVGCGSGSLLRAMQQLEFHNLSALEPSLANVEYIRSELQISCYEGSFSDFSETIQYHSYDLVCLTAVLEHLVDTHSVIKKIALLLKPGGQLFICVPNAMSFDPYIDGPFQEFSTEHINYFCFDSLRNLLGMCGFDVVIMDSGMKGVLSCIFTMTGIVRPIVKSGLTIASIQSYIDKSENLDNKIKNFLHSCNGKLICWGTGTLTLRLLALGILRTENIKVFVDLNPKYIGKNYNGVPIVHPNTLAEHSEPILVSSFLWKDDILAMINRDFNLKNEVFTFDSLK